MIEASEKKEKREQKEYNGSRWAGVILLAITLLISLIFYLKGQIREEKGWVFPKLEDFQLFGPAKYEIRK